MLEIKNVTKVYKTKGGVETRALDGVSISFGETGLVFLLGKSGSGKSTLLNVCGGLDEPTSGEVIVKGKSSKDFSGSDFDSYRNTFVGFIFQEYNVLDEFNVEDNIALALELQGKPKDKQKITKLLQEVELGAFAKRKPNTLSGGQKQRIAIARALVKEPQIIMADEPTGALDSATGKQVFDTLKKLSQSKLVIVVSHDREFAEIYGDRIVELKDGKIISDVTKAQVEAHDVDENVKITDGNTLTIKSGSKISKSNLKAIQDFVSACDGDVIITKGEKQISAFRKANRMTEDGATETFNDTDPESIELKQYTKEDSRFIRSRLPAHKAIKIGASGLKLKPVRLIFTIFLSFIAFTMFGLFSTLMVYDGHSVTVNSFANSDYDYLNIEKEYVTTVTQTHGKDSYSYENATPVNFTEKELADFRAEFGANAFGYYGNRWSGFGIDNVTVKNNKSDYYLKEINKFACVPATHSALSSLKGSYPVNADEICISSYLAEVMLSENSEFRSVKVSENKDLTVTNETLNISTANDLIGKRVALSLNGNRMPFIITGIFESGAVSDVYDVLKDGSADLKDPFLPERYDSYLKEGLFKLAFVSDKFYGEYKMAFDSNDGGMYIQYFDNCKESLAFKYNFKRFNDFTGEWVQEDFEQTINLGNAVKAFGTGDYKLKTHFFGDKNKNSLAGNEIVVGMETIYGNNFFDEYVFGYFKAKADAGEYDGDERLVLPEFIMEGDLKYDEWDESHTGYYEIEGLFGDVYYSERYNDYTEYLNVYERVCKAVKGKFIKDNLVGGFNLNIQKYIDGGYYESGYLDEDGMYVEGKYVELSQKEREIALADAVEVLSGIQPIEVSLSIDEGLRTENCKIVGFHEMDTESDNSYESRAGLYLSQQLIDSYLTFYNDGSSIKYETNYVKEEGTVYNGLMLAYDKSASAIEELLDTVGSENRRANDVQYRLNCSLYNSISTANDIASTLSMVFLGVGLVFAVFSALLMFNFISMSISNKRKEIGILRAVGARGTDVFKIFFAEAGIIVGICTVLALIGAFFGCGLINSILKSEMNLQVTLFVFGIVSVGMMVGIALVVAFISTFLPVFFAARKKPVDSIRAL